MGGELVPSVQVQGCAVLPCAALFAHRQECADANLAFGRPMDLPRAKFTWLPLVESRADVDIHRFAKLTAWMSLFVRIH